MNKLLSWALALAGCLLVTIGLLLVIDFDVVETCGIWLLFAGIVGIIKSFKCEKK